MTLRNNALKVDKLDCVQYRLYWSILYAYPLTKQRYWFVFRNVLPRTEIDLLVCCLFDY